KNELESLLQHVCHIEIRIEHLRSEGVPLRIAFFLYGSDCFISHGVISLRQSYCSRCRNCCASCYSSSEQFRRRLNHHSNRRTYRTDSASSCDIGENISISLVMVSPLRRCFGLRDFASNEVLRFLSLTIRCPRGHWHTSQDVENQKTTQNNHIFSCESF